MNIKDIKPEDILVKERFTRMKPFGGVDPTGRGSSHGSNSLEYETMSQADFLREFYVSSHAINSLKYYPNPIMDKSKTLAKIRSRFAVGWQEYIHTRRLATITGNGIDIKPASRVNSKSAKLVSIKEGWAYKMMDNAIYQALASDGKVGDAAFCAFLNEGKFGWRVFGYDKGDTLYPHYDPLTGKMDAFGRKYRIGDKVYLDVYGETEYMRYVEDMGWKMDISPIPHGFKRVPIAYTRYGAPFWSESQDLIEGYEFALSQLAENNLAYAMRILYSLGKSFSLSATLDGTPTRIDSPDPNAKLGFLEPADASSSFELQFNTLKKDLLKSSHVCETPEIKSGSDVSSLAIKMMFADQYLKGLNDAQFYQPFVMDVMELFLFGYGVEISDLDLPNQKVIAKTYPYIFMSETEESNTIVQLTGVGALSKKSASEEAYNLGYGVADEYTRIQEEENQIQTNEVFATR